MADEKTIEFRGGDEMRTVDLPVPGKDGFGVLFDGYGRVYEMRAGEFTLVQPDPEKRPALSAGWIVRRDADGVVRSTRQF